MQMKLADFPQMKENERKKWHRQMHALAFPRIHDAKPLTTEELALRLKAAIHG